MNERGTSYWNESIPTTCRWACETLGHDPAAIDVYSIYTGMLYTAERMNEDGLLGDDLTVADVAAYFLENKALLKNTCDRLWQVGVVRFISNMGELVDIGREWYAEHLGTDSAAVLDELTAARMGFAVRNREQQ